MPKCHLGDLYQVKIVHSCMFLKKGEACGLAQLDKHKFVCYSINKTNDNPL